MPQRFKDSLLSNKFVWRSAGLADLKSVGVRVESKVEDEQVNTHVQQNSKRI
jgi:hypothetical protein